MWSVNKTGEINIIASHINWTTLGVCMCLCVYASVCI